MTALKYTYLFGILLIVAACGKAYVPTYVWPDYLEQHEVEDHKEMAADGFELYKQHCGACHGITTNGKKGIPNFTKDQIDAYNDAYELGDSTNHAVIAELTEKDVEYIFVFLEFSVK